MVVLSWVASTLLGEVSAIGLYLDCHLEVERILDLAEEQVNFMNMIEEGWRFKGDWWLCVCIHVALAKHSRMLPQMQRLAMGYNFPATFDVWCLMTFQMGLRRKHDQAEHFDEDIGYGREWKLPCVRLGQSACQLCRWKTRPLLRTQRWLAVTSISNLLQDGNEIHCKGTMLPHYLLAVCWILD